MPDSHSESEIAKRRDAALTRALSTPPKPKSGVKKPAKAPVSKKPVKKKEAAPVDYNAIILRLAQRAFEINFGEGGK